MAQLNIAIADDNPQTLRLLGDILEGEDGFHVVGKAENGEEAYNMIIIIHRFASSHYYYIRYPLSRYALDPVNLIQHFRRKKVSCPASNSGSTKTAPHFTAYL